MQKTLPVLLILLFAVISSAAGQPTLLRGPYLQAATSTSIVIRWRTDSATNSRVRWGNLPNSLTNAVDSGSATTEHIVKLSGLNPLTKYYYSIGSTVGVLQGDTANYFTTFPLSGSTGPLRIGVIGDCGNNSINQVQVRNSLQDYLGSNYLNCWILLGDNAYTIGADAEYQAGFFNIYRDRLLKQNPLYPAPGNHDYGNGTLPTAQDDHNIPYYQNLTLPVEGEAGGVASHNPAYYSFNIGNVHFLSLDSYGREDNATRLYDTLGRQVQWIKQDLAANRNRGWVIAYWHHPPFTKGSHNSDTEGDLAALRTNFIRILERLGVDMVLCGHSHDYERSKLQLGHYGTADTFDPALHNISTSSALYDGSAASCPFLKDSVRQPQGTVYVVSGSAGQLGGTAAGFPHNAMYYSDPANGGSMLLEVQGNRLDAKWICADGVIRDRFTMMKDVNRRRDTTINSGSSITLTASYIGNYIWQPGGQTTRSVTVAPPPGTTTYTVKDNYNCVADTFTINTLAILPLAWGNIRGWQERNTGSNHLQWQTLTEQNVRLFEVERSADGRTFHGIGKVNATGNSSSPRNYSFTDEKMDSSTGLYYYRIKQIDAINGYQYSPVVAIKMNSREANTEVQIVPNPGRSSDMKIRLENGAAQSAIIKLTDAAGTVVFNHTMTLNATLQSFLPEVKPGIYFLTIAIESTVVTRQIVVK